MNAIWFSGCVRDVPDSARLHTGRCSCGLYTKTALVLPYGRDRATRALWKKYKSVTELRDRIRHTEKPDSQLYYTLVIQAHLQEDKLIQNSLDAL